MARKNAFLCQYLTQPADLGNGYSKTKSYCLYLRKHQVYEANMRKILWLIIILTTLYAFFVIGYAYFGLSDPAQDRVIQQIELNEAS